MEFSRPVAIASVPEAEGFVRGGSTESIAAHKTDRGDFIGVTREDQLFLACRGVVQVCSTVLHTTCKLCTVS